MVSGFFGGGFAKGFESGFSTVNTAIYDEGILKLAQQREQNEQKNKQRAEFMKLRSDAVSHLDETMSQLRIAHPELTDAQLAAHPAVVSLKDTIGGFDKNLGLPNTIDSVVAGLAARPSQAVTEGALARAKEGPQHQQLVQSEIERNQAIAGTNVNPDLDTDTQLGGSQPSPDKGNNFLRSLPGARGLNAKGLYDGTTPLTAFSTRTGRGNTKSQRQQAIEDAELYGEIIGQPFDINKAANLKISETAQTKADASTLTQLTQTKQALSAFEDTAQENAKILIDLSKKIPDTGSPILNRPIRAIAKDALGNPDVAAFNFQLQSVKNELSRIITNPRLTGQLTDNARAEIGRALDEGATPQMIIQAYNTARKDFQNRSGGLEKSIKEVTDRLAGQKSPVTKTYKYNPDTGELE